MIESSVQYLKSIGFTFRILRTIVAIVIAYVFFFFPVVVCLKMISDTSLKNGGIPSYTAKQFIDVSARFEKWANSYTQSQQASKVDFTNCAATEWPMFGAVYYLLSVEEMQKLMIQRNDFVARKVQAAFASASQAAARIIADPKTGAWVEQKWGESYRAKENVFYRMLLIMGLSSYQNITKNDKYQLLLKEQSESLAIELKNAPYHVLDDYPGECYPSDVLWAVAAILRADRLLGTNHTYLRNDLMCVLSARSVTREGLPAYAINKETGFPVSAARGCSNSGILVFASEIDPAIANRWYAQYEKYFWQDNGLLRGFREFTLDHRDVQRDVDTGPIVGGYGSVASLFGIGAARTVGRLDHSVPLTMEVFALSWPTPFGLLIPSFLSYVGTGAGCLGDVAVIFLMTRPILSEHVIPFKGGVPWVVWLACFFYGAIGIRILFDQWFYWRKYHEKRRK